MDKNDFDVDFDFEKEYGFDPSLFMDADETEEELSLIHISEPTRPY